MCQCVAEHTGYHGYDPAWKETWLRFADTTDYEETQNLKRYNVKESPNHTEKDKILKRIDEFKSINILFSMKSETNDGLSSCSNFLERQSSYELESDKPVLTEVEHLRRKIGEVDFESLRAVLNRKANIFSKHRVGIG